MRAVAVERAGSVPVSPVYQITVLAVVPAIVAVAVSKGGPSTRCGGLLLSALKKSLEADTADAAVSDVAPSLATPAVMAACRLVAVSATVGPTVNCPAPGGELVVAVRVRFWLVPSGK